MAGSLLPLLLLAPTLLSSVDLDAGTFSDTFESGALTAPGGPWDFKSAFSSSNTLSPEAAAAHRESYGLRLVDNDTGGGEISNPQGWVRVELLPAAGPSLHVRAWVRIRTTTKASGRNPIILLYTPGAKVLGAVAHSMPGDALELTGDSNAGFAVANVREVVDDGWHLVELSLTGLGTASGERRLWLDGVLRLTQSGLDLTNAADPQAWYASSLNVGQPYSYALPFIGVMDFDDVRMSKAPLASRVRVVSDEAVLVGGCGALRLDFLASNGEPADSPPVPLPITLQMSGADLYADSQCTQPAGSIGAAASVREVALHVKPRVKGEIPVRAQTEGGDLLEGEGVLRAAELVARIRPLGPVQAGETVTLDASGSLAIPGRRVATYRWTQLEGPAHVAVEAVATPEFQVKEPGDYAFELVVADGAVESYPAVTRFTVGGERQRPPSTLGGCYCGTSSGDAVLWGAMLWLARAAFRRRANRESSR